MEFKEIAPGIIIYSNVFNNHDNIVKQIELASDNKIIEWSPAYSLKDNNTTISEDFRKTENFSIFYEMCKKKSDNHANEKRKFENIFGNMIYEVFDKLEKHYCSYYKIEMSWHDSFNVLRYSKGHFVKNHIDDSKDKQRRISYIYYPNDNYKGGELEFPRFNIKYKPKSNDMIFFPSTYVYNHNVSEVTEGTRYAIVSWLK